MKNSSLEYIIGSSLHLCCHKHLVGKIIAAILLYSMCVMNGG
jgi:hypothetical protein